MMEDLQIRLRIEGVDTQFDVHPVFNDKLKIKIERQDEQIFHRHTIDGTFQFVGRDFDVIEGCGNNVTFTLLVYRGSSFLGSGTFRRTDCTFNYDDKNCSVRLKTTDRYENFLAHYDDKFNLVRLSPISRPVTMQRRGVLQLYVKGENVLTNIVGGMSFEQPAIETMDVGTLTNKYKFTDIAPMAYISISPSQIVDTSLIPAVGNYYMSESVTAENIIYKQEEGRYRIQVAGYVALLIDESTGLNVASADVTSTEDGTVWTFTRYMSGTTQTRCRATYNKDGELYGRYLCPSNAHDSVIVDRPTDDICDYDMNYPYVRYSGSNDIIQRLQMIVRKSSEPTPWGIDGNLLYFTAPVLTDEQKANGDCAIPVGHSHWERFSTWLILDDALRNTSDYFNNEFVLKDAYPLWSAIDVLLAKIDTSLSFGKESTYSEFLSEDAMVIDSIITTYPFPRTESHRFYISPITNVKKTYYEQAAQRGDVSLKQILDMLRKVFQCYWWIDDDNKLRIEHIVYFKNGGSYAETLPAPSIDVTAMMELPNRKPWSYSTNEVSYETDGCPSRYEFSWGDSCTEQFNGTPIDVKDEYLKANGKESISVENFFSDIDYAIVQPNGIGNDIYALIETDVTNTVPLMNVRLGDATPVYKMQNGSLSFLHIEKTYYPFDLSGWKAFAEDVRMNVYDVQNIKRQALTFPVTLSEMSAEGIVRTEIGDGLIESMNVFADTLMATTDLRLRVERDYSDDVEVSYSSESRKVAKIRNNSDRMLEVTYIKYHEDSNAIYSKESVSLNIGEEKDVLNVGLTDTSLVKVINVVDVTPVDIGRVITMKGGVMSVSFDNIASGAMRIIFDGKKGITKDYGLMAVTARRDVSVKIVASTENSFDLGWADANPKMYSTYDAQYKASGTQTVTFTLNEGESLYVGYTKDSTSYANDDIVIFEIL